MPTKSSVRGTGSAKVVSLHEVPSITGEVSTHTVETQKSSVLDDPYETWLRSQAQSLLGRSVTLDEAKELWGRIDINTRKPFPEARRPSPLARLLTALRARSAG